MYLNKKPNRAVYLDTFKNAKTTWSLTLSLISIGTVVLVLYV